MMLISETNSETDTIALQAAYKLKDNQTLQATLTEQHSQDNKELSSSNIFSLSGGLTDNFKLQGSYEKGTVQSHNGRQYGRHAGSISAGYIDKHPTTREVTLQASSKLEFRLDEGQNDKQQLLSYTSLNTKPNPNTHLFAKCNLSHTKDTTSNLTEAEYKEFILGAAYRPICLDRLNLLAKYSYLEQESPTDQTDISDIQQEQSHTISCRR